MPHERRQFGNENEQIAIQFLEGKGFEIIDRQFLTRLGEIDIVAREGEEYVFVEVKARRSDTFGFPEASVTPGKLRKIGLTAELYTRAKALGEVPYRIDVIAIEYKNNAPVVTHFVGVG